MEKLDRVSRHHAILFLFGQANEVLLKVLLAPFSPSRVEEPSIRSVHRHKRIVLPPLLDEIERFVGFPQREVAHREVARIDES